MRFWDSSAVVPLLFEEPRTPWVRELLRKDRSLVVWWGTEVECASAIARWEREEKIGLAVSAEAFRRLKDYQRGWREIGPAEGLRESATRFVRVHALTAADALQLAAAYEAAERRPWTLQFVCLDERLSEAARRDGFLTIHPRQL